MSKEIVIPQSLQNVNSMLEGLPGAESIMQNIGDQAVKQDIIKITDKPDDAPAAPDAPAVNPDFNETEFVASLSKDEKAEFEKLEGDDREAFIAAKAELSDAGEDEAGDDEPNPLLQSIKSKGAEPAPKFEVKSFEDIQKKSKDELGIVVKDAGGFAKVISSAKKWRTEAAQVPDLKEKMETMQKVFDEAPAPIIDALKAYFNGDKDWASKVNSGGKFDFSKPVEKQDTKALVEHYFPGKFTDEDFDAEVKPTALEIALQASTDKYNTEKGKLERQSADEVTRAQNRMELRNTSMSGSLTTLKQSFPNLNASDIKNIQRILESGDISSLFISKDGSWKPEAAKSIMMVLYGEKTITSLMKNASNRAVTKERETILARGKEKPDVRGGGGGNNAQMDAKVKEGIDTLVGALNKKKTY